MILIHYLKPTTKKIMNRYPDLRFWSEKSRKILHCGKRLR